MKKLILVAAVFCLMVGLVDAGELIRVEKLTEEEKLQIDVAEARISEAQANLINIKRKIAEDHQMKEESWMEWSSTIDFDGEYILLRKQSHMSSWTLNTADVQSPSSIKAIPFPSVMEADQ